MANQEHIRRLRESFLWEPYCEEDRNFLALSLCGEAGELANKIKKLWDRRTDPPSESEIAEEVADVRILLELLAVSLKIDIDESVGEKLDVLCKRYSP
jgi:NTP pyrophosphatase (non-canonical NTP hydrolase)